MLQTYDNLPEHNKKFVLSNSIFAYFSPNIV